MPTYPLMNNKTCPPRHCCWYMESCNPLLQSRTKKFDFKIRRDHEKNFLWGRTCDSIDDRNLSYDVSQQIDRKRFCDANGKEWRYFSPKSCKIVSSCNILVEKCPFSETFFFLIWKYIKNMIVAQCYILISL